MCLPWDPSDGKTTMSKQPGPWEVGSPTDGALDRPVARPHAQPGTAWGRQGGGGLARVPTPVAGTFGVPLQLQGLLWEDGELPAPHHSLHHTSMRTEGERRGSGRLALNGSTPARARRAA